jgi:hypothetical protein
MRDGTLLAAGLSVLAVAVASSSIDAQRAGAFRGSTEDPAIKYSTAPLNNLVADVNRKMQDGAVRLAFEGRGGYLRSALEALQIPVDSQLLVFSKASLQGRQIYAPAFDALPARVRDPIYRRLWEVLSGDERGARYRSALSRADRQSIVEILRDTKPNLPPYFGGAIR